MDNYKLKIISVEDVEEEKDSLFTLTDTYDYLVTSLAGEFADPEENLLHFEHDKLIYETTDLNAGITNVRWEVKEFDKSTDYKKFEQLKSNVDFFCDQDCTALRFKELNEKIQNSLKNYLDENFENLNTTFEKRGQDFKTQLQSLKAEVDAVKQDIEEINANQTDNELETVLNEKKNIASAIEPIDSKEIKELGTLLYVTRTGMKRSLQKNETERMLVTQENASPKPFFSQVYADPKKIRYAASFASQKYANLPRM